MELSVRWCLHEVPQVYTYTLGKVLAIPRAEQPAGSLNTVEQDNSHEESLEPASLLALEQAALQIIDHRLAQLHGPLLHGSTQLAAQKGVRLRIRDLFDRQATLVRGLRQ